jgi:hypothetical protein
MREETSTDVEACETHICTCTRTHTTGINIERKMIELCQKVVLWFQTARHGYIYCRITVTGVNVLYETL